MSREELNMHSLTLIPDNTLTLVAKMVFVQVWIMGMISRIILQRWPLFLSGGAGALWTGSWPRFKHPRVSWQTSALFIKPKFSFCYVSSNCRATRCLVTWGTLLPATTSRTWPSSATSGSSTATSSCWRQGSRNNDQSYLVFQSTDIFWDKFTSALWENSYPWIFPDLRCLRRCCVTSSWRSRTAGWTWRRSMGRLWSFSFLTSTPDRSCVGHQKPWSRPSYKLIELIFRWQTSRMSL